jgi:hypothetical protein
MNPNSKQGGHMRGCSHPRSSETFNRSSYCVMRLSMHLADSVHWQIDEFITASSHSPCFINPPPLETTRGALANHLCSSPLLIYISMSRVKIGALWPLIAILGCIPHNSGCTPPCKISVVTVSPRAFHRYMGLGGVDTNLVDVLPVCQFCQFPAKTGKLTTGPPRSCLRPLDPYIDDKLSTRRLRRLFYMGGCSTTT